MEIKSPTTFEEQTEKEIKKFNAELASEAFTEYFKQCIKEAMQKINNSPETKQFQKEMEYLQTINDIFEGKIKFRSDTK